MPFESNVLITTIIGSEKYYLTSELKLVKNKFEASVFKLASRREVIYDFDTIRIYHNEEPLKVERNNLLIRFESNRSNMEWTIRNSRRINGPITYRESFYLSNRNKRLGIENKKLFLDSGEGSLFSFQAVTNSIKNEKEEGSTMVAIAKEETKNEEVKTSSRFYFYFFAIALLIFCFFALRYLKPSKEKEDEKEEII